MLRKFKIFTIITAFILLMSGCDLDKKIGESITENIMEKAIGDDVEVDVDGEDISNTTDDTEGDIDDADLDVDSTEADVDDADLDVDDAEVDVDEDEGITIKGEDGTIISGGGVYEWPEGQAADYLPKFDGGKIFYVLNSDDACSLMIQETVEEDYNNYVEIIIGEGYTVDKFESAADDMLFYTAQSEKGIVAYVSYIKSEATMQISVELSGSTN